MGVNQCNKHKMAIIDMFDHRQQKCRCRADSEVGDVKIFGKFTMAEDDGLKLMVKSIQVFQGGVEKRRFVSEAWEF